jgi:hypothetical protein
MRTSIVILVVVAALAVGFVAGAQTNDAPFNGYWWRAAPYRDKANFVWGWDMGHGQGVVSGCAWAQVILRAFLAPEEAGKATEACISSLDLTKGFTIPSEIVVLVDRFYNDPQHAAVDPSNAISKVLQGLEK